MAVARSIVSKPKVVLADEPTANLDSKTGAQLLDLMKELNEEHKRHCFHKKVMSEVYRVQGFLIATNQHPKALFYFHKGGSCLTLHPARRFPSQKVLNMS